MSGDARAQVQEPYSDLDRTGVEADQRMAYYGAAADIAGPVAAGPVVTPA